MAQKTMINGTVYDIIGGKVLVNGTNYKIVKGKVMVNGTIYTITIAQDALSEEEES